jgi:SAM-dependent methyltransferase
VGGAAQRWRDQLEAWAIPDHITAAVTESPWVLPTEVFTRRADQYVAAPTGISWERAAQALAPRGSVLDVGAGAGAASLPLVPSVSELIAVDSSETMLDALAERAGKLGLAVRTIIGRWPDVAADTPVADVVVCHHVFYNAPDLDAFAAALHDHARRRVVVELPEAHPLHALNPLWKALHGLDRPTGPTFADAVAVLREAGISPHAERWRRPPRPEYGSFDDLLSVTRRRLCLPPERTGELADALIALGVDRRHPRDLGSSSDDLVTLWWDVASVGH